jgi:hypothetical protein
MLNKEKINSATKDKEMAEERFKVKLQELENLKGNDLANSNAAIQELTDKLTQSEHQKMQVEGQNEKVQALNEQQI